MGPSLPRQAAWTGANSHSIATRLGERFDFNRTEGTIINFHLIKQPFHKISFGPA